MSWEIYIQDLPDVATVADIPEDFMPGIIGRKDALLAEVLSIWPTAEESDKEWVLLQEKDCDLSVRIVGDGEGGVRYIAIHVHGGSSSPQRVAELVQRLGRRALDTETGAFFDTERPDLGYVKWQAFKDQNTGDQAPS